MFVGSIPSIIGNLKNLEKFRISHNEMTGSLPSSLSNCRNLKFFDVGYNQFYGSISRIFTAMNHKNLSVFATDNNQFTGSLLKLFDIKSLTAISLVSNCFSFDSFPTSLCALPNLDSLVLDGIKSATSCRNHFLFDHSDKASYFLKSKIKGGIPSCLFNMPKLSLLHLAGNAISGSLPKDLIVSTALKNLSLTHNLLAGSIPTTIQLRPWFSLDLSFNEFDGTLHNSFHSVKRGNCMILHMNRLSGDIPHALTIAGNSSGGVEILEGNMFSCPYKRVGAKIASYNNVNDPYKDDYICGSKQFDAVIILYSCICGYIILFTAVTFRFNVKLVSFQAYYSMILRWYSFRDWSCHGPTVAQFCSNVIAFNKLLDCYQLFCLFSTSYFICVLLPTYLALKSLSYSMYEQQYAWGASIAFLSGSVPTITITLLLAAYYMLSALICIHNPYINFKKPHNSSAFVASSSNSITTASILTWPLPMLATVIATYCINTTIIVSINAVYLLVVLGEYDTTNKGLISIVYVIATSSWNNVGILHVYQHIEYMFSLQLNEFWKSENLLVSILNVNNIAIPLFTLACLSPTCFKYVLEQSRCVITLQKDVECKDINEYNSECSNLLDSTIETFLYPPFIYSYQCSSVFITSYSHVLVYSTMITGLVIPLTIAISRFILENKSLEDIKANKYTYLVYLYQNTFGRVLLPFTANEGRNQIFKMKKAVITLSISLGAI